MGSSASPSLANRLRRSTGAASQTTCAKNCIGRCAAKITIRDPGRPARTGRDRFNDLLPKWAVARLGTVAFRHGLAPFWDTSLNFSLDDKHLVSAGGGWLRRWDVATGHASVNLGDGGFTNKGMLFPQTLFYFSTADGKIARVIDNQVTFVKGQATGEFAGGRAITENNLESGEERAYRLQLSESRDNSESPRADVLSPDGKTFAVVTRTGDLALWNAVDGTATHYLTPTIDVFTRLAFHPDGKSVVVGDDSHNIRIFDLATGNEQRTFGSTDGGAIYRMAISPNGKWLVSLAGKMHGKASGNWLQVGPLDSFLRLWNLEKGKEELKIDMSPNDGGVESILFTPDSRTLTASCRDRPSFNNNLAAAIRTWDIPSGKAGWRGWPSGPPWGSAMTARRWRP